MNNCIIVFQSCRLKVRCSSKFNSIGNIITVDDPRNKRNSVAEKLSDSSLFSRSARPKRNTANESLDVPEGSNGSITCNNLKIPLSSSEANSFSTNVRMRGYFTSFWLIVVVFFLNSGYKSSQYTLDMKRKRECTTFISTAVSKMMRKFLLT